VSGEMNLKHAAELIIERLEAYEAAIKAKVEKSFAALTVANDENIEPKGSS